MRTKRLYGNPFFATQLLRTLYEEKQIFFDVDASAWTWSIESWSKLALADSVVEFMSGRSKLLSADAQEALKLASCSGHSFSQRSTAEVSR
ncbi:MAG: hypothetical protein JNJ46_10545 [Myxococcales bacterium]|nr:hypothetical protein [Myxococcales bacterium]